MDGRTAIVIAHRLSTIKNGPHLGTGRRPRGRTRIAQDAAWAKRRLRKVVGTPKRWVYRGLAI